MIQTIPPTCVELTYCPVISKTGKLVNLFCTLININVAFTGVEQALHAGISRNDQFHIAVM